MKDTLKNANKVIINDKYKQYIVKKIYLFTIFQLIIYLNEPSLGV